MSFYGQCFSAAKHLSKRAAWGCFWRLQANRALLLIHQGLANYGRRPSKHIKLHC